MRPDCGCTLIQKTHEINDTIIRSSNGNRIVIIRNPYDSFKSLRNLNACGGNHVGNAPAEYFNGSSMAIISDVPILRRYRILHICLNSRLG